ncbi:hypothetical protein [Streptomyces sp. Ru73]|uniref:hypothetical protein n=1 Tax=Streptomyces sp. Ru73 TaxID=2080748 RepID=UPI0015E462B1|nr:hypothetical protein [Streptomyces sp. Ru73]
MPADAAAALPLLLGEDGSERLLVDARVDGFEDQALQCVGSRASTSHWTGRSTSKPYARAKPATGLVLLALRGRQPVREDPLLA